VQIKHFGACEGSGALRILTLEELLGSLMLGPKMVTKHTKSKASTRDQYFELRVSGSGTKRAENIRRMTDFVKSGALIINSQISIHRPLYRKDF
jgi:hypothetical protein